MESTILENINLSQAYSQAPVQVAVYISGHGYGHMTRTLNLLDILSRTGKYNFHIRTTSKMHKGHLDYELQPAVIQINAYQLDATQSLQSLKTFSPSLAIQQETLYLSSHNIQAVLSDALSLPCLLAHQLKIPSILITNFTFDGVFQSLLDATPQITDGPTCQEKIDELTQQYAFAHAVIRLPGYVPFRFTGPKIIEAPMHFRRATQSRASVLTSLGLSHLSNSKFLLHCFGGHNLTALHKVPELPEGWICLSQTISAPPSFYQLPAGDKEIYMPDLVGACDAVIGKLGWGTCSEILGNGYKPLIYVPRSQFFEEVGLLNWMENDYGRIVKLEVDKYEGSDWLSAIEEAGRIALQDPERTDDWEKNEVDLIRIFGETIESALK
jgi:hypothetical protein